MLACTRVRAAARPTTEIADVVRLHGRDFRRVHPLSSIQARALKDIERCRTEALGGHLDVCRDCGLERPAYNSCRNRHCPKCQSLAQARWIHARTKRLLPTHYFHVVFTLPAELRPLARANPALIYDILFLCAAETLLTLGRDPNRLSGLLGVTAVLHTWTRDLRYHPHVHCIVTGGAWSCARHQWHSTTRRFLFPVHVMGALFRGQVIDAIRRAHGRNRLRCASPRLSAILTQLQHKRWVVYAKRPFGGPEHVLRYLGRYTHRVGISNQRMVAVDRDQVVFRTKAGKITSLTPHEFLRRFVTHILPHRFVKIRHYGLLAPAHAKTTLELTRASINPHHPAPFRKPISAAPLPDDWRTLFVLLTGFRLDVCPRCQSHNLVRHPLVARAPP